MNNYYIHYYGDFGNTYELFYAPAGKPVPADWERITRREAIAKCREERIRREETPSNGYYATDHIYPARIMEEEYELVEYTDQYIIPESCFRWNYSKGNN